MKLESLNAEKFKPMTGAQMRQIRGGDGATNTTSVFAGKGWCETPTLGGSRPDLGITWSSDIVYTDGNGNRVGMDTTK